MPYTLAVVWWKIKINALGYSLLYNPWPKTFPATMNYNNLQKLIKFLQNTKNSTKDK